MSDYLVQKFGGLHYWQRFTLVGIEFHPTAAAWIDHRSPGQIVQQAFSHDSLAVFITRHWIVGVVTHTDEAQSVVPEITFTAAGGCGYLSDAVHQVFVPRRITQVKATHYEIPWRLRDSIAHNSY